jgi:hypothetical protein
MPVAAEQAVEKASMSWGVGCGGGGWDERSGGADESVNVCVMVAPHGCLIG